MPVVCIGMAVASGLMALAWLATPDPPPNARGSVTITEVFRFPANRAEVMINRRDGPAFAQLAVDPTLAHPAGFHDYFSGATPREELAYRAGRPLLAWLTWLTSLGGRRALLAPSLMLLTVLGLGGALAATALLVRQQDKDIRWVWTLVLLPGLGVSLWAPGGCEPLAVALGLFGLLAWMGPRRTALAVLLWSLAALARETTLIIPVAIALASVGDRRYRLAVLLVPAGVYASWLLVVRWRTGVFVSNAGGHRVSSLFRGLGDGTAAWGAGQWAFLIFILAFGVLAWNSGIPGARWIVMGHVVVASALGPLVWEQEIDFTRVFVLVEVLGLIAMLRPLPAPTEGFP